MVRSSALFAALASLAACGLSIDSDDITPAVDEATSASALATPTELAGFPDGENCEPALDVRARALFETWFANHSTVQSAQYVSYSGHATTAYNSGGNHRMHLRSVLPGEAGGLILQIQIEYNGLNYANELAFFDAAGNHTATVEGVYYFHLDDHTLLVSTAMGDAGVYRRSPWLYVSETVAAVSLTGQVRWRTHLGGAPLGLDWATFNPNTSTWSMYHPRRTEVGNRDQSNLFFAEDGALVWSYYAELVGSGRGGLFRLDPQTGKTATSTSAITRDRLCTLTSTDPACTDHAQTADILAGWWAYWELPYGDTYQMTGFLPPSDDGPLMIEVATLHGSAYGRRTHERKLLFYPDGWYYPYLPQNVIDGMYYFHADAQTIVTSRTMGSSGSYGPTQTPWYESHEYLVGATTAGVPLWGRPFRGRPSHSGSSGTTLDPAATLTRIETGAVMWWSFDSANGGYRELDVFDPVTGLAVPAPSPYRRRTTCTPVGSPLWRTRTAQPNLPFTSTTSAVSTLTFNEPGALGNNVHLLGAIDRVGDRSGNTATISLARGGVTVLPPVELEYFDVVDWSFPIPQALRGQPIAGDWTLTVSDSNQRALSWWTLGVERQPPPAPLPYSYTATSTNSARINTTNQTIALEAGQTLTIGTCGLHGAVFTDDTYLRLFDAAGAEIAVNDDFCGRGSRLTYTAPASQTVELRAGCWWNTSCTATVAWLIY